MTFSTVKLSCAVVCACTVIMQCGTNGVLQVTSRMYVALLGPQLWITYVVHNCPSIQYIYCCMVVRSFPEVKTWCACVKHHVC